jgi:hypothetical protein
VAALSAWRRRRPPERPRDLARRIAQRQLRIQRRGARQRRETHGTRTRFPPTGWPEVDQRRLTVSRAATRKENARICGLFPSPLADSNRRPPPYHRADATGRRPLQVGTRFSPIRSFVVIRGTFAPALLHKCSTLARRFSRCREHRRPVRLGSELQWAGWHPERCARRALNRRGVRRYLRSDNSRGGTG